MFKLTSISIAIFIATLVNLFVAYSSWRRRTAKNGPYFAFAMIAATGWTLAAGLDYAAVPVALKVSFAKLEYLTYTTALACFTAFALSYAGYGAWLKKLWVKFLLIGLPAITTLFAWTNDWHGLIWSGFTPNPQADNVLIFNHGPAFTLIALVGYGLIFTIFVSLLAAVLKGNILARKQARLLLWALLALVASNLIYLFDVFNIPGVDWSSIAFSITGLLFLFALYGSRFMDIVPIARTTLIERMTDGVLVLDTHDNLVDFNPAAQSILGLHSTDLWTPWPQALARWPEVIALLKNPARPQATEIAIGNPAEIFDLRLTLLEDNRHEVYGVLVVMRDITARKQAEFQKEATLKAFTQLTDELGERVKELNCLYGLSDLIEAGGESIESLLQSVPELLSSAWQYPSVACARVTFEEQTFSTPNFRSTPWTQQRPILVEGVEVGRVVVGYLEVQSGRDEELFLPQEERLLEVIAERLGRTVEGIRARRALHASEERYQNFIAHSFEAISRTEFDEPIDVTLPVETQIDLIYKNAYLAECNQAMADMYHVSAPQALVGMRMFDAHGGQDQLLNRAAFRKLIANGYKSINDETLEYAVDGQPVWFLSNTIGTVTNGRLIRLWGTAIDITVRKQAEAALRESEALYRQVFTSHSAVMLLVDPMSGTVVQANDAAAQFYGYSLAALQQMNLQQIVRDLSPEEMEQRSQQLLSGEEVYFTAPHQLASGEVREVEVHSTPIQLEGRTLLYSIIHDVTRRKQAEAALYQRNQMLAALQQVMLDLIERHEVNDILEALLIKIGALVNAPHVSVDLLENENTLVTYAATPDQPLRTGDTVRRGQGGWLSWQAIETGQPALLDDYSTWEQRRSLFDGFTIRAILIMPLKHGERVIGTINLLRTTTDQPFTTTDLFAAEQLGRIVAVVLDNAQLMAQLRAELAERHRVEDELRVFSRAVEQSQIAVMITDTQGAIEYVNAHFTQMTGYTLAEVRGRNPRFLRSAGASPEVYRDLWTTISAGQEWRGEFQNRKKNGDLFWDATLISPIVNEQGRMTHFVARKEDVTERKRAAEALLKMAAFEERQRMARDLHDSVNQSIHSLVLFAETLLVTLERQPLDRARHIAARMQESARQALKETRLLLYQIRSPLEASVNLIADLEARLAMVERYAGLQAQLTLDGSLDYLPPDWSDNLFWIAVEALNNALKHAQAHSVQITLRCAPHAIELDVVDDGCGFDPNRVRAGRLGLSNLHNRAALIGGKLDILSAPGQGCRIHFYGEIKHAP